MIKFPPHFVPTFRSRALALCGFALALATAGTACAHPPEVAQAKATRSAEAEAMHADPAPAAPVKDWLPEFAAPFFEAQLALNAGNHERALARLQPLAQRDNAPEEIFVSMVEIHLASNDADKANAALEQGLKRYPESTALHILQARALRMQSKFKEAISTLEAGLKFEPTRQEALSLLSELHLQQLRQVTSEQELEQRVGQLINVYERMLTGLQGSDRMGPLLILSQLQLRRNNINAALPYAREATELDGREARAWLALAGVQEAQKQTSEALKTYTQALLLQPADSDVRERIDALLGLRGPQAKLNFYLGLAREYPAIKEFQDTAARMLLAENRWNDAEERLRHITTTWPDDSKARLALVRVWLAQGKLEEGIRAAELMAQTRDEFAPLVTLSLAEALAQKGNIDRGIKLVNDLYGKNRDDESLALGAATLLGEAGKHDQGLELLKEFRQRNPASFKAVALQADLLGDTRRFDEAYAVLEGMHQGLKQVHEKEIKLVRAQLLQEQKKWADALALLTELIKAEPENNTYQISAGYANQQLGNQLEAERHYREAVKLSPEDPESLNSLGYFLAETNQDLDEALTITLKAHQLDPSAGHILDSLGWVYFKQGDYRAAVERLEEATKSVRAIPDAAEMFDHLGDAYEKAGNIDKARAAWRRALELNKDWVGVREKLNRKQTGSAAP